MEQFLPQLQQLLATVVLGVLGYGCAVATVYVKGFFAKLREKEQFRLYDYYLHAAERLVLNVVAYVEQDYVKVQKEKGLFEKNEQLEALERAKTKFLELASDEVKNTIVKVHKDISNYLNTQIEKAVLNMK